MLRPQVGRHETPRRIARRAAYRTPAVFTAAVVCGISVRLQGLGALAREASTGLRSGELMTVPRYRDTTGAFARGRDAWVRLKGPVDPPAVETAAAELSGRSDARLVVVDAGDTDLAFLADLPPLHHLEVIMSGVRDVGALDHHAKTLCTVHLELGRHPVAVDVLGSLSQLRQLYLQKSGPAAGKGALDVMPYARQLEHLVLHSVSVPSIEPLTALPALRGLALKLGGAPDLTAFPALRALRFFEAWQVRGLTDLSPVAASRTLEVLYLESLRGATLPDFSGAVSLQHVKIDNLPLREGLAGLATAPALRQVFISRCVFNANEIEGLPGHPTFAGGVDSDPRTRRERRGHAAGIGASAPGSVRRLRRRCHGASAGWLGRQLPAGLMRLSGPLWDTTARREVGFRDSRRRARVLTGP
jgi:hypothetical protein